MCACMRSHYFPLSIYLDIETTDYTRQIHTEFIEPIECEQFRSSPLLLSLHLRWDFNGAERIS